MKNVSDAFVALALVGQQEETLRVKSYFHAVALLLLHGVQVLAVVLKRSVDAAMRNYAAIAGFALMHDFQRGTLQDQDVQRFEHDGTIFFHGQRLCLGHPPFQAVDFHQTLHHVGRRGLS